VVNQLGKIRQRNAGGDSRERRAIILGDKEIKMNPKLSFTLMSAAVIAIVLMVGIVTAAQTAAAQSRGDAPRAANPGLGLSPEGLAIYHASEQGHASSAAGSLSDVGMAIYHASEWGRPVALLTLPPHVAHPGR
jgi:hypothetical protein